MVMEADNESRPENLAPRLTELVVTRCQLIPGMSEEAYLMIETYEQSDQSTSKVI